MDTRRSFFPRLGAILGALSVGSADTFALPRSAKASAEPRSAKALAERSDWQPAREAKDDWLDQIPGKHRLFFDALTAAGTSGALTFSDNYFTANKAGYGLDASDVAVVICLRYQAMPFALTDALWAKYGAAIGESMTFNDPKTGQAPVVNVHKARLEGLVKRGVHFAVCDMASHRMAGVIARKVNGDADAVYKEMTANAVGNAHFVPAGIVAVNRAQERGYSIAYTG